MERGFPRMAALRLLVMLALVPLLAGCSSTVPEPVAADIAPVDAPAEPILVSADGTLALGNCIDAPAPACVFNVGDPTSPKQAGNIVHVPIEGAKGTLSGAAATLTWTASSPFTEELVLRASLLKGCPDQCQTDEVLAEVQGASPLTLTLPATTVPDGLTLGFTVVRGELLDSGNRVSLLQDFHAEAVAQPA
jgi:hypothetical protein